MLQSVHGVILRTVDYGESSVIFEAYTKDLGMMSFIVSGVRKKKAAISPALIKPGTIFDATAYIKPNKDLHRVKELTNGYTYVSIPFDFIRGSVALFCVEVFSLKKQVISVFERSLKSTGISISKININNANNANGQRSKNNKSQDLNKKGTIPWKQNAS